MSTKDLTQQRYELADLIGCTNDNLSQIRESSGYLFFYNEKNPGTRWSVKLTPTGRIKKNSLRVSN